jgi:predicted transcriptional regulator
MLISNNSVIILCGYKLRPPCELVVRSVLPAIRSLVAKRLIEKYHFSQVAAAEKLGTTQASISHYLYSKRGDKRIKQLEASPSAKAMVNEIAEGVATEKFSPFDAMLRFCKLCKILRTGDLICDWHKDFIEVPEACDVCPPTINE